MRRKLRLLEASRSMQRDQGNGTAGLSEGPGRGHADASATITLKPRQPKTPSGEESAKGD